MSRATVKRRSPLDLSEVCTEWQVKLSPSLSRVHHVPLDAYIHPDHRKPGSEDYMDRADDENVPVTSGHLRTLSSWGDQVLTVVLLETPMRPLCTGCTKTRRQGLGSQSVFTSVQR